MSKLLTYKEAGVDIEKGNQFVDVIKNITENKGIGGFSGIFNYKNDKNDNNDKNKGVKLVASTDGVGSKLEICKLFNKYDTIGIDLVAMSVNDIICQGAKPLFFLDYYSSHRLDFEKASDIISGIHEGCKQAECILLGGETAEMPTIYKNGDFDLAGFAVGAIENELYPKEIVEGDVIYGLPSSGLHSNGFTLIHRLLDTYDYKGIDDLRELLTPTKIYVNEVNNIIEKFGEHVKGFSHITGGGLIDNIPRIFDRKHNFSITHKWNIPSIFKWIYNKSDMSLEDMLQTYNCGIGMVVVFDKKIDLSNITDMIPIGSVIKNTSPVIDYDSIKYMFEN